MNTVFIAYLVIIIVIVAWFNRPGLFQGIAAIWVAIGLLIFWKRLSRAGVFASLITGTLSAVIWKTWLAEPTGISERLASYLLAFGMAVLFSLILPEKS